MRLRGQAEWHVPVTAAHRVLRQRDHGFKMKVSYPGRPSLQRTSKIKLDIYR